MTLLSTWDKQELEEKLGQRVEFSKRAIGKLLQAFDRMLQRNEKLHHAMEDKVCFFEIALVFFFIFPWRKDFCAIVESYSPGLVYKKNKK